MMAGAQAGEEPVEAGTCGDVALDQARKESLPEATQEELIAEAACEDLILAALEESAEQAASPPLQTKKSVRILEPARRSAAFDLETPEGRPSLAFGPEDEEAEAAVQGDEGDEVEDSEFDVANQRRRVSYLQYFGLAPTPQEDEAEEQDGDAEQGVKSPRQREHRKSSAVSILFDAGVFNHWTDIYQTNRACQPVLLKKLPLRVEAVDGGEPPVVVGTRDFWVACHAHGKSCYGPAPAPCDDWPMQDRLGVVIKPQNQLIYRAPNQNSTATLQVYPIYTDVKGERFIRLGEPDATAFWQKAP
ncbi:hypothetical protein BESB_075010 [Besnoitia besnoiti]|uniref:Uncharacterized protein n=1 Tax=Besnoitia besnoiti TaxID=94643 RepID=A0A2A9M8X2_BESBE|nr:uncharacterized protein BESB_075010 [Besnoitia besnoiti]PFH34349.1 hypothetical protein BESB_075010 [Besnoitia besnoiti]